MKSCQWPSHIVSLYNYLLFETNIPFYDGSLPYVPLQHKLPLPHKKANRKKILTVQLVFVYAFWWITWMANILCLIFFLLQFCAHKIRLYLSSKMKLKYQYQWLCIVRQNYKRHYGMRTLFIGFGIFFCCKTFWLNWLNPMHRQSVQLNSIRSILEESRCIHA